MDDRNEDQEFQEFVQGHQNIGRSRPGHGMTRLGESFNFRAMPYPVPPDREAEINREYAMARKAEAGKHRSGLIAFATGALAGKNGRDAEEIAMGVMRTVDFRELLDPNQTTTPENCCNLVLWDIRRRCAYSKALSEGMQVPQKLKTRGECLAIHNARKVSDDNWDALNGHGAANQKQGFRPKPQQPPPTPPDPSGDQGSFSDWRDW